MIPLFYTLSYFNSHAHVERDAAIIYAVQKDYKNFNSHAHVERDNYMIRPVKKCYIFQLTRSR